MAQIARFFDGPEYGSQDFAEFFSNFLDTGYFDGLEVIATDSMNVILKPGSAFIEGYEYKNTSDLTLTVPSASPTQNRYDRIVIRLNRAPDTSDPITALVRTGTSSGPPSLIRNAVIYEISVAQIFVQAGKSFIEQSQISDERNNPDVCGPAVKNGQLPLNYRKNESTLDEFPFGLTTMRINDEGGFEGGFPSTFGVLITTKVTRITGTQMFFSTTTNGDVWVRSTSAGAWLPWRRIDGSEVQYGGGSVQSTGNDTRSVNITFPRPYKTPPRVTAVVATSVPNSRAIGITNTTTTGFTAHIWNGGSSSLRIEFDWIAKGEL